MEGVEEHVTTDCWHFVCTVCVVTSSVYCSGHHHLLAPLSRDVKIPDEPNAKPSPNRHEFLFCNVC
jgi:hypothetical protein